MPQTKLKSVSDALRSVCQMMADMPAEDCPTTHAQGRVLAQPVNALLDHPAAAVSAMDGYAVCCDGRPMDKDRIFQVIGEAAAGHLFSQKVRPGEAVRIFTGAHLPQNTDTVILQEDVSREQDRICCHEPIRPGQFVRPKGLDFCAGQTVIKTGTILNARQIALAVLAGCQMISVRRKPMVAILSSGDELVTPDTLPTSGQLINSNSVFLSNALIKAGALPVDLGILPDKKGALIKRLEEAEKQFGAFDLILSTGGASVGAHDHIVSDLEADQQSKISFWRIAMRPGKPLISGAWRKTPFLGLPGNPVSAGVCYIVFVLPAIQKALGLDMPAKPQMMTLAVDMPENDQRQDYIRAEIIYETQDRDQQLIAKVRPFDRQDSSMLRNFSRADILIIRPPFAPPLSAGQSVAVLPIPAGL